MTNIRELDLTGCILKGTNRTSPYKKNEVPAKFLIVQKCRTGPWKEMYEKIYLESTFLPKRVFQSASFINECYLGGSLEIVHKSRMIRLLYGDQNEPN